MTIKEQNIKVTIKKMKNKEITTKELLEFLAKVLSWDYGKDISPNQVFIGFQMCLLTNAPFKECVLAAFEASKNIH